MMREEHHHLVWSDGRVEQRLGDGSFSKLELTEVIIASAEQRGVEPYQADLQPVFRCQQLAPVEDRAGSLLPESGGEGMAEARVVGEPLGKHGPVQWGLEDVVEGLHPRAKLCDEPADVPVGRVYAALDIMVTWNEVDICGLEAASPCEPDEPLLGLLILVW
nr:hypothetical protein [Hyalangium versicolor]